MEVYYKLKESNYMETVRLNIASIEMQVPDKASKVVEQIEKRVGVGFSPCDSYKDSTIHGYRNGCYAICENCVFRTKATTLAWIKQMKEEKK